MEPRSRVEDAAIAVSGPNGASNSSWRAHLENFVRVAGHRNWIVIADSAYPAQARAGIETIVASSPHIEVLQDVLATLAKSKHLRPVVHLDQELSYLEEKDAPGIAAHREMLARVVRVSDAALIPHDTILATLDKAGRKFRVLVIKTGLALPYTSVFVELDCGYWNSEAERSLRARIAGS